MKKFLDNVDMKELMAFCGEPETPVFIDLLTALDPYCPTCRVRCKTLVLHCKSVHLDYLADDLLDAAEPWRQVFEKEQYEHVIDEYGKHQDHGNLY